MSGTATILLESELKTFCIGLKSFDDRRATGPNVQNMLNSITTHISKHNPFMLLVSDQGSNFVNATNRDNIHRTDFDDAVRCVCHKLHLAVVGNLRRYAKEYRTAAEELVDRVRVAVAEVGSIACYSFIH